MDCLGIIASGFRDLSPGHLTAGGVIYWGAFRPRSQPRLPFRLAPNRVCRKRQEPLHSTSGDRQLESRLAPPP